MRARVPRVHTSQGLATRGARTAVEKGERGTDLLGPAVGVGGVREADAAIRLFPSAPHRLGQIACRGSRSPGQRMAQLDNTWAEGSKRVGR
eukprot:1563736-Rhodomonas_salina.1